MRAGHEIVCVGVVVHSDKSIAAGCVVILSQSRKLGFAGMNRCAMVFGTAGMKPTSVKIRGYETHVWESLRDEPSVPDGHG